MQRPSPRAATSPFSNSKMSWMKFQAQRLLALRRHVTHLMMGSDMSGNCEIKGDDVSCKNDKIRRRTRALDASTTEAARGGLINNLSTDRKNEHKHNSSTAHVVSVSCPLKIPKPSKTKQHTVRKNRDPLPTHFVATAEDCTYRAVNIFGTCVTRVMRITKRADSVRHVEPGLTAAAVLPWTA